MAREWGKRRTRSFGQTTSVGLGFFFKQKTAYEMCGRDWSSDVCSSDLKHKEGESLEVA